MLGAEECERARVRRDRRYDGHLLAGVRTTRIYRRLVCPVPSSSARCRRRRSMAEHRSVLRHN